MQIGLHARSAKGHHRDSKKKKKGKKIPVKSFTYRFSVIVFLNGGGAPTLIENDPDQYHLALLGMESDCHVLDHIFQFTFSNLVNKCSIIIWVRIET